MADRLLALAAVLDGLDRRPRIRMRHAPHETAQRLLDSLGVLVFIDLSAPPCAQRCKHKECRMTAIAFEPNWISYRHSLVQVDKRRDADDETLEICAYCECEVDVDPAPHKPDCRGIGGPRASSATSMSPPLVRKPAATKAPAKTAPQREPEGLDLLEAMDAGEPLPHPDDEEDELELDEEVVAEGLGPDGDASSSSPELEEEEVAAVGKTAVSGSASLVREPERAAIPSHVNPYGLQKMGRGYVWTEDTALQAVHDFAREHGHPPTIKHARDLPAGTLPSTPSATELFGSWADLVERAGFARPTKGTDYSKLANGPAAIRAASRAADKRQATAAAPPEPEPRDIDEPDGPRHEPATPSVEDSPTPAAASPPVPSRFGGALEAPPDEDRLLVPPPEEDRLQRALSVAAIAAARAFADTLEQELAA